MNVTTKQVDIEGAQRFELSHEHAVPLLKYTVPDSGRLNAELKRVILKKMEETLGVTKSNVKGWHSPHDLAKWPEPCVQELLGRLREALREMVRLTYPAATDAHLEGWKLTAWANVNKRGASNVPHSHGGNGNAWASFYYVEPGLELGEQLSGLTKFQDRSGLPKEIWSDSNPYSREIAISPAAGLMLLFPATLWHYVDTYLGNGQRITIACNFKHPAFNVPSYENAAEQTWWWRNFRGLMILPRKVHEKAWILALLPRKLVARVALTARPSAWLEHVKVAWSQAIAEASHLIHEREQAKRLRRLFMQHQRATLRARHGP